MVRDTTRAAHEKIESSAATLRGEVLRFILSSGGATDEEIQKGLGMGGNTERPRRRELEAAGLIWDSGQRRTTTAERDAIVWTALPGADQLAMPTKKAPKPTREEMRIALAELRSLAKGKLLSPSLVKLGRWIASQCEGR